MGRIKKTPTWAIIFIFIVSIGALGTFVIMRLMDQQPYSKIDSYWQLSDNDEFTTLQIYNQSSVIENGQFIFRIDIYGVFDFEIENTTDFQVLPYDRYSITIDTCSDVIFKAIPPSSTIETVADFTIETKDLTAIANVFKLIYDQATIEELETSIASLYLLVENTSLTILEETDTSVSFTISVFFSYEE